MKKLFDARPDCVHYSLAIILHTFQNSGGCSVAQLTDQRVIGSDPARKGPEKFLGWDPRPLASVTNFYLRAITLLLGRPDA